MYIVVFTYSKIASDISVRLVINNQIVYYILETTNGKFNASVVSYGVLLDQPCYEMVRIDITHNAMCFRYIMNECMCLLHDSPDTKGEYEDVVCEGKLRKCVDSIVNGISKCDGNADSAHIPKHKVQFKVYIKI